MVFDYQKRLDLGWGLRGGGIITNMIIKNYAVVCPYCNDRNYVRLVIEVNQGFYEDKAGKQCNTCNNYFEIEYSSEIIIATNIP